MISPEQLQLALGTKQNWGTEALLETLNALEVDGADLVRENWLTHASILREGNHTMEQYTTAVKYVSLKQMGHSNVSAYSIALPDRYQDMVAKGYDEKRISSSVSAYHKGAMVQKMLAQSAIPLWLLYQDEAHKAIGVLAKVMNETDPAYASARTRVEAADKLLQHIARPESATVELNVNTKPGDGMKELHNILADITNRQLKVLQNGGDVRVIANLPVIDGTCVPVGEDK